MSIALRTTDRAALAATALLLAAAPAAFLFATAWLPDPESGRVALQQGGLLALCAGVGLCTLALAARGHRAARAALVHPAVLLPLALALLALLLAPLHPFPLRTVEGLPASPYHHAAALFHVEIALLAAGYLAAARGPWRTPLAAALAAAAAAAAAITAATLNFDGQPWLAVHLPAWYGFAAAHLLPSGYRAWIAPVGLLAAAALSTSGRGPAPKLAAAGLLLWMLWISNNSTAMIGAAGAAGWLACERVLPRLGRAGARAAACAAILLGPLLLVPPAAPYIERADTAGVDAAAAARRDGIPSLDPRDHVTINLMPGRTIWSRSWMQRLVIEDLAAHPRLLATGRGWGTFAESHAAHWREVTGRRFREGGSLASKTHWDAHSSARFHPHNTLVETVSSLGLAGGLLVAALLALPALRPRRAGVPVALGMALCTVSGFWFLESSFAPALAFALAATVRPFRPGACAARAARAAFAAAIAACLAGSALALSESRPAAPPAGCESAGEDGPATFARYEAFLTRGLTAPFPIGWIADRIPRIEAMACAARAAGAPGHGLDALSEMLRLRDLLLTGFDGLPAEAFAAESAAWKGDLTRLLAAAPGRTDAVVPYVAWTVAHRDGATAARETAELRRRVASSSDPVGPWLDACAAFLRGDADGHRRAGLRALDLGIANVVAFRHAFACAPPPPPGGEGHSAGIAAVPMR